MGGHCLPRDSWLLKWGVGTSGGRKEPGVEPVHGEWNGWVRGLSLMWVGRIWLPGLAFPEEAVNEMKDAFIRFEANISLRCGKHLSYDDQYRSRNLG